jgi:hypothetical protein
MDTAPAVIEDFELKDIATTLKIGTIAIQVTKIKNIDQPI